MIANNLHRFGIACAGMFGILSFASLSFAGYTTPNSGVHWNLDSLVAYSGGTLTGIFPGYALNDTLTVAQNDYLEIQPGAIVTVAQGSGIGFTILGAIVTVGTETDSIVVKGLSSTSGSHRGFRIEDSAVDSLCEFAYCRIQDATEGIHCLNANPTIDHCLFTNNGSNGVRCFGASPVVRHCLFIENRRNAITANLGSSPLIENNVFANNNYENTSPRNQVNIGAQGINTPVIRNNEIYNQNYYRTGAISLVNIESGGACAALVEGNFIHDNSFGILSQGVNMTPLIRYNVIENNRINPDPLVSGSGISVQVGGPTNAPVITGNILRGNYWGITCVSSAGLASSPRPNIGDITNADTSDDGWNIFDNNNNGGIVYQLYNNGTEHLSAQNNYWGSEDSSVIESWIYHRADSSVFGQVDYMPYGCKGLGSVDTFAVRQSGERDLTFHWVFSCASPFSTIRLEYGRDSLLFDLVGLFPDTVSSFTYTVPESVGMHVFFRLSSFNRFGEGDSAMREAYLLQPNVEELPGSLPAAFGLERNYPNPFNPLTTIRYKLPVESRVTIAIYDLLGKEVETIVHEQQPAGHFEVIWKVLNAASGVYFCSLDARPLDGGSAFRQAMKLMVVK